MNKHQLELNVNNLRFHKNSYLLILFEVLNFPLKSINIYNNTVYELYTGIKWKLCFSNF